MTKTETVLVPDIGDFSEVDVVEVMISTGDTVAKEQSLISLESDKASLDVPSPMDGVVGDVMISVGDKVSKGTQICTLEVAEGSSPDGKAVLPAPSDKGGTIQAEKAAAPVSAPAPAEVPLPPVQTPSAPGSSSMPHATPSVRRFARELSVELRQVTPSGAKGRILKQDVEGFIRGVMKGQTTSQPSGAGIPRPPQVDFAKYGPIEAVSLGRVQTISATRLSTSWLNAPQVTQFDLADITELEAFRKQNANVGEKEGFKFSLLPFLIKACVTALTRFPNFNSSLSEDGAHLVLKKYFHIGIAVDTPAGLMVPVLRDADKKGLIEIARELASMSARAREGKSRLDDFQGGCFTISSLGGIGGTAFTPIVNVPEVAILGVSRAAMKPVYNGEDFVPRLMLPLSLTYDHRVIDGAAAARFTTYLSQLLADVRRMCL